MENIVEIAKNVPVPPVTHAGPKRKYPFNEMAVGDSLSFDSEETFHKARRAATLYAKRHGVVFTSRKGYQDGEKTGLGGSIWRVE